MPEFNPAPREKQQHVRRVVVENRQAHYLYAIEDTFEAGLMLEGWEVKAILGGRATFNGGSSFVRLIDDEAFVDALTITPLPQSNQGLLATMDPLRLRKLLLKKTELNKLQRRVAERGYTLVPLTLTQRGKLKLEIGLAKGKKLADKRQTLKDRDVQRDTQRELSKM